MQLFLQLNTADLPVGASSPWYDAIFQVFYCTNSDPPCEADCEAYDPFARSTLLRAFPSVEAVAGGQPDPAAFPAKVILGWDQADDYPGWEELRQASFTDADAEEVGNSGYPRSGEKLGGWPYWVQGVEYPNCPDCGAEMKFFFQIDSEGHLPYMFGDVGCGHVTYCEKHPQVIAFRWACH